jgi:hypothetical protein
MRTGAIQGTIYGNEWQAISDTEVTALDSYTKLLIHGDSLTDATGKTVTANGGVAVTSSQYKLVSLGRSISFDGSGDYLTLADSADWAFGSGDFTIDFGLYLNSIADGNAAVIWSQYVGGPTYITVYVSNSSGDYRFGVQVRNNVGPELIMDSSRSITSPTGAWHHLALIRSGSVYYLSIDGDLGSSIGVMGTGVIPDVADSAYIGRRVDGSYELNGYLSELRVSKGIARWTANFTPPTDVYGGSRTNLVLPNLDGNTDKEYRLITRIINGYSGTSQYGVRLNGDSGTNYGYQYIQGSNTTADASRGTTSWMYLTASSSLNYLAMSDSLIYSKSGYVRTGLTTEARSINGTSVGAILKWGTVWTDTSNNITSLVVSSDQASSFGIGSRIILMRRADKDASLVGKTGGLQVYGKAKGCWQLISDVSLNSAVQTYTFTGLDGDTDVMYDLKCRFISNSASPTYGIQFNGDTASNYGYQYLYGSGASLTAGRGAVNQIYVGQSNASSYLSPSESLIYAKTGYVRTVLNFHQRSVEYISCGPIWKAGNSWNNTSSNITSITVTSDQANGIGGGTTMELWAYRP